MGNTESCCVSRDKTENLKPGGYKSVVLLNKIQQKKFTDDKFPATKDSLIANWGQPQNNYDDPEIQDLYRQWSDIKWIRADEIPCLNDDEGHLQVFAGKIEPNDIQQGIIGDCYFLSVLSVLTEKPDRVKRLFHEKTSNNEGVYAINVTKNGK